MTHETGKAFDVRSFRRWRKKHKFATPELETKALLVERDLELLPQLGEHPGTRAQVMTRLATFADAMAGRHE